MDFKKCYDSVEHLAIIIIKSPLKLEHRSWCSQWKNTWRGEYVFIRINSLHYILCSIWNFLLISETGEKTIRVMEMNLEWICH